MRQSIGMGVANGFVETITFQSNPIQFFLWIFCLPLIRGTHFYFIHRLLHIPFLYKHVHSTHHRNVNTGPWSGISMHPVENIIYQSSPLIHLFIPTDPIIFTLHLIVVTLNPAFTHSGFEQIKNKKTKILIQQIFIINYITDILTVIMGIWMCP